MAEYESLSHSEWECKYHVIFIPKCRRKTLYGSLWPLLGEVFRRLAEQKQVVSIRSPGKLLARVNELLSPKPNG